MGSGAAAAARSYRRCILSLLWSLFLFFPPQCERTRASGSGEFGKGLLADRLFLSLRALFFPLFLPVAAAVLVTASGRLGREWAPYAL